MFTSENNPGAGRPKGSGNKNSAAIKQAYQLLLESNLDDMSEWLAKIAVKDPARALELMLKISEYILPKLARTEVTGSDGEDLFKNISFTFQTANKDGEDKEGSQG